MKGMVFTSFLEMVDEEFGFEVADQIIEASDLKSGGAYTSVGTYDYRELIQMVDHLSASCGLSSEDLSRAFGQYLFTQLADGYPQLVGKADSAYDFLEKVDSYIRVEVRKLYPDAELPEFICERPSDQHMIMTYRSPRPFGALAEGLLRACVQHFGEEVDIQRHKLETSPQTVERFTLVRRNT